MLGVKSIIMTLKKCGKQSALMLVTALMSIRRQSLDTFPRDLAFDSYSPSFSPIEVTNNGHMAILVTLFV